MSGKKFTAKSLSRKVCSQRILSAFASLRLKKSGLIIEQKNFTTKSLSREVSKNS